ncbi:hypothetical protein [Mycobacteroides franklinii]|uniref:hypothetical protein n=1 Tax=Mycobacteroides franklinii TaxID=948102 RepID=UPI0012FF8B5D|nr:hypothetical protein [Mycobacteroides franklinii]
MSENRWNVRQFAKYVQSEARGFDDPRLIWVTEEALRRGLDAWHQGVLDILVIPLPTEPVIIGLETPVGDELSAADLIGFHPTSHAREILRAERGYVEGGLTEDARLVRAWRRGGEETPVDYLTSGYGGALTIGEEQMIPAGSDVPPPALGGDPLAYARDQLITSSNITLAVVWALIHEPQAQDDAALTVERAPVTVGKKRARRDYDISVVDVKRGTTTRYAPSGRHIEHDHRWVRRGHWAWRACGRGKTERRRVWIDEVVCGPADKPLIRRPKVSVLR